MVKYEFSKTLYIYIYIYRERERERENHIPKSNNIKYFWSID